MHDFAPIPVQQCKITIEQVTDMSRGENAGPFDAM